MKKLGDFLDFHQTQNKKSYRPKNDYLEQSFDFISLVSLWPSLIGDRLAEHTIPLKLMSQSLTILTHHSAYSQQVKFVEPYLVSKIEDKFPALKNKIQKFNFVVNQNFFELKKESQIERPNSQKPAEKTTFHPFDPKVRDLRAQAEKAYLEVEDNDLKERLISLFIQKNYE